MMQDQRIYFRSYEQTRRETDQFSAEINSGAAQRRIRRVVVRPSAERYRKFLTSSNNINIVVVVVVALPRSCR